ncbi:MAG: tellurite resistance/C4-dicarboxylate transporter family protein [Terrimesophilobacter sp.]
MSQLWVRLDADIRTLPPGAFAFVMATGIVSTALLLVGWSVVSYVMLALAITGLVALTFGLVWRLIRHPDAVARDAREPERAFGYFTIVAAINVVAVRLYWEAPVAGITLAIISVPIWLLLNYGVQAVLMLGKRERPVATQVNGSWFLWVVATQSLAAVGAEIAQGMDSQLLAAISVALWGIGVVLYLMLATLVTLRLLTTRNEASTLGPSYWIYMGATAITVLAGSHILAMPSGLPIMAVTTPVVAGLTYVLWAFGVWWIPLLVIFGVWRHGIRRVPLRYESDLWSIVFPLGMYSVASMHFGAQTHLPLIEKLGEYGAWISGAAWLAIAVAMVVSLVGHERPGGPA